MNFTTVDYIRIPNSLIKYQINTQHDQLTQKRGGVNM